MGTLRDRRGFTLMELLVALMISSVLVAVIYQLMAGNSQYVQMQSSREEVQQNARAALDVIAADLRTVPPQGIRAMGPDSIRFYLPRAWGVLCDTIDTASGTAWAIFPASLVTSTDFFGQAHWGVGIEQTPSPENHTDSWRFVTAPTRQGSGDPCSTIQPNLDPARHVTLGFNRPAGTQFVDAGSLLPGTQVVVFEEVRYDVAPSSSSAIPGSWIRRMVGRVNGVINMQPMAGPVPASDALRLQYFRADGVTAATAPADVRRVSIRVVAQSRAQSGTGASRAPTEMDTVSTDVYLRNVSN